MLIPPWVCFIDPKKSPAGGTALLGPGTIHFLHGIPLNSWPIIYIMYQLKYLVRVYPLEMIKSIFHDYYE